MVTASHLPFNRNGFKFCTSDGGLEKPDVSDILARAAQHAAASRVVGPGGCPQAEMAFVMARCLAAEPSLVQYVRLRCDISQKVEGAQRGQVRRPSHASYESSQSSHALTPAPLALPPPP